MEMLEYLGGDLSNHKWMNKNVLLQSFFCLKKKPDQHVATKSRQFNVATYKVHFSAFNRRNPDRRSFK